MESRFHQYPMNNDFSGSNAHVPPVAVDRREFLQSAVGAGLALTATSARTNEAPDSRTTP